MSKRGLKKKKLLLVRESKGTPLDEFLENHRLELYVGHRRQRLFRDEETQDEKYTTEYSVTFLHELKCYKTQHNSYKVLDEDAFFLRYKNIAIFSRFKGIYIQEPESDSPWGIGSSEKEAMQDFCDILNEFEYIERCGQVIGIPKLYYKA